MEERDSAVAQHRTGPPGDDEGLARFLRESAMLQDQEDDGEEAMRLTVRKTANA